jgi:hypothetical protein
MTNVSNIAGVTQSAQQVAPPPAGAAVSTAATSTSAPATTAATDSNAGISPRIVIEPYAGVVIQILNSTGQVQSQIPSTAAVAYLNEGLGPNGQPPASTTSSSKNSSTSTVA